MYVVRGKNAWFKFRRKDNNGDPIVGPAREAYFIVKYSHESREYIFRKSINDMELDAEGWYHCRIETEDTENLDFRDYAYDIEVFEDDYTLTISSGTFTVGATALMQ